MIGQNLIRDLSLWAKPTLDVLVAGKASLHIVEFPWPAYVTAVFEKCWPLGFEMWGRLLSMALMPLFFYFYFSFLKELAHDEEKAGHAAFFACLSPAALIYFQSFQMDAWALTCLAGSFYFFLRLLRTFSKKDHLFFTVLSVLTYLAKPHWLVYYPGFIYLAFLEGRIAFCWTPKLLFSFSVSAAFLGLWVWWNFFLV